MTNIEKIKAMNREKMAKYIAKYADDIDSDFCKDCPAFESCVFNHEKYGWVLENTSPENWNFENID